MIVNMNASSAVYQADGRSCACVSEQQSERLQSAGPVKRVVQHLRRTVMSQFIVECNSQLIVIRTNNMTPDGIREAIEALHIEDFVEGLQPITLEELTIPGRLGVMEYILDSLVGELDADQAGVFAANNTEGAGLQKVIKPCTELVAEIEWAMAEDDIERALRCLPNPVYFVVISDEAKRARTTVSGNNQVQ